MIGTPHFMAPEIILGEGYTFCVDIWAIAICMFKFACGKLPFGNNVSDPMDIYQSIINSEVKFSSFMTDTSVTSLLIKLLSKNPLSRLYKFVIIKTHSYFKDFNWVNCL